MKRGCTNTGSLYTPVTPNLDQNLHSSPIITLHSVHRDWLKKIKTKKSLLRKHFSNFVLYRAKALHSLNKLSDLSEDQFLTRRKEKSKSNEFSASARWRLERLQSRCALFVRNSGRIAPFGSQSNGYRIEIYMENCDSNAKRARREQE
ncbi:hypothetical protein EVAR_39696_1 [Eumeta japonica]|uniref:Uncharacterized protein n=1 Tax=Eumeta variegata TaxID=151549 RepID=A0A4C1W708_EUMVA|nr:hypothetical protein EVAR_39696_1 [Eumeta japonica]